jgi:hypothetical protein
LANAVFHSWEARYKPTFDSQVAFREAIAVPLSNALKTAGTILDQNKIWLRAKASEAFDAFLAAMEEVRDINYACGHVMLGQVEGSPTAYLLAQRPFNAYSLIDRMERATCLAAHRISESPVLLGPELKMQSASALEMPSGLDELLSCLRSIPSGDQDWAEYEKAIERLLTAIFAPILLDPECQSPIHEGRKRIDITYRNGASSGFFNWLTIHRYPSAYIFVEAKNYCKKVANPEIDQLAGRFSEQRGKVGLLVCRQLENKGLFLQRCRDTFSDGRGCIIPVDDEDLEVLVRGRTDLKSAFEFPLLRDRFKNLVMNRDH